MIQRQTFRQGVIISGLVLCTISDGFIFGQMSGMVADLQSKNSKIPLSDNDISWIAATINVTCVCGYALASILSETFGRRRAVTILTTPIVAVWVMLYYAQDMTTFMASRVLVGFCFGGVLMLSFIVVAEYVSPDERGIWLNVISSVGPSVGTSLGHVLGILLHWRTVALLGIIPTGLSAILPLFWVENPSWLASKGRFEECEAAFRALHRRNDKNEMELNLLIEVEKWKLTKSKGQQKAFGLKIFLSAMKQRYFWKLAVLSTVVNIYRATAGKIVFSTLAITMLQEMTGTSDIILFTLFVDGCAVLGACLSCYLISRMKMRTMLFSSAALANVFLIALSACLYFKPENNFYFPWIISSLLSLYFITVNAGPYPVLEATYGEIFPLEIKGSCTFVFGSIGGTLHFLTVKFASRMFGLIGYHGVFFCNAVVLSLCLVYFWFRLPETKGRTLQEIELYFKNNTYDKAEDLLSGNQMKVLI